MKYTNAITTYMPFLSAALKYRGNCQAEK